jgi:WD40 repeat protein
MPRVSVVELDSLNVNIRCVQFSADGNWIVGAGSSAGSHLLMVWDAQRKQVVQTTPIGNESVWSLAISHSGGIAATGQWGATHVRLWEIPSLKLNAELPLMPANPGLTRAGFPRNTTVPAHLAFSPDDMMLAAGCWDCTAKLWDLKTRELCELQPEHAGNVDMVGFVGDGELFISCEYDRLKTWITAKGMIVRETKLPSVLLHNSGEIWKHVLSPDGRTLASVSIMVNLRLADQPEKRPRYFPLEPVKRVRRVNAICFSPDSSVVAIALASRPMLLWNLEEREGRSLKVWGSVVSMQFSPDGNSLLCAEERAGASASRLYDMLS